MTPTLPPPEDPSLAQTRGSRRGCLWRLGCLAIWFPLIMLPLVLFALAIQGEVALWHNSAFPSGAEHPVLQIKLLMDIDTRGLNVTRSYVSSSADGNNAACVQTHVRYLLWQGESTPADYCDCYARASDAEPWTLTSTAAGQCE